MLWCGIWQPRTLRRPVTLDIEPSSVSPNSHSVASRPRDGSRSEDAQSAPSQLKEEALSLRKELASIEGTKQEKEMALASSISAYVSSLPEGQLKLLTASISDDVVTAMRQIVTYILRAPSGDGPLDKDAEVNKGRGDMQDS